MKSKVHSTEVQHLINDVKQFDEYELQSIHGIQILSDGTVYDLVEHTNFKSIEEWATAVLETDAASGSSNSKMQSKLYFDDEY
jgi:hypothetical protein